MSAEDPHWPNPIWRLGFRPFFLAASVFAALAIPIWLAAFFGWVQLSSYLPPMIWHAHEMIYGFATAVIAGFVLTAVQNWTGKPGVSGLKLKLIFILWCLARLLLLGPPSLRWAGALVDLGFYPVLAIYLFPYLRDPEMKIERVFFAFFAFFFAGNLLVHLDSLGWITGGSRRGLLLGLDSALLMIIFMGGRVIPFFTESSVAKAQPKTWESVETLSHVSAWLYLLMHFFAEISVATAVVAFCASVIHFIRLKGWYVRRIRRVPIIWVLHVAYLWIVVGFALAGLAGLGLIVPSLATHAFTVGAVSAVTYGMISRVSLGHTGRPLRPVAAVVVGYYLLIFAAIVRVFVPMIRPALHDPAMIVSGFFWVGAFGIFVIVYWPILSSPGIDGRAG